MSARTEAPRWVQPDRGGRGTYTAHAHVTYPLALCGHRTGGYGLTVEAHEYAAHCGTCTRLAGRLPR